VQALQADISILVRARSIQSRQQKQGLRPSSDKHYHESRTQYSSTLSDVKEGEGYEILSLSSIRFWVIFKSFCEIVHGFFLHKEVPNRNQTIPESSEIFTASKAGDAMAVLTLLEARKASPFDRTPKNSTPLRVIFPNRFLKSFADIRSMQSKADLFHWCSFC
jgi:hypothetical protein